MKPNAAAAAAARLKLLFLQQQAAATAAPVARSEPSAAVASDAAACNGQAAAKPKPTPTADAATTDPAHPLASVPITAAITIYGEELDLTVLLFVSSATWWYVDDLGTLQGPFRAEQMIK